MTAAALVLLCTSGCAALLLLLSFSFSFQRRHSFKRPLVFAADFLLLFRREVVLDVEDAPDFLGRFACGSARARVS